MSHIIESKDVWVVYTNTDNTEGRGWDYAIYHCDLESTAKRLAKGRYVQGSNSPIKKEKAYKIVNEWYYPGIRVQHPDKDDKKIQKLADEREAIIDKAKALGLSEDEIQKLVGIK